MHHQFRYGDIPAEIPSDFFDLHVGPATFVPIPNGTAQHFSIPVLIFNVDWVRCTKQ